MSNLAAEYWHALQVKQPAWALQAYERLVSTLSQDVQQRLQFKGSTAEPYVAVYGKTQVGKTTLLLDLMGIDPRQLARVSKVLRGGRDVGLSATSTTMEYCRSPSECWGLSRNNQVRWMKLDEDMSQALADLRIDMEFGRLNTGSEPCIVSIPQSCFLSKIRRSGIRILDLPGDKPENHEEQRHVYQMAKTYLPFADLILLVGRGDDLGFLRPGEITLPGIEDWQSMPYRFRIVTTYSYNAKSVKDILRKEPDIDVAQVRQRLIEQVERFGKLSDPARETHLYFPLEFGNSWKQTEKDEPLLHSRMAPIIEKLRDELLQQITSSITPMGRLRSTLDTHISVQYVHKKKTQAIDESLKALNEQKSAFETELERWSDLVKSSQKKILDVLQLLAQEPHELCAKSVHQAATEVLDDAGSYKPEEGSVKNDRETLYTLIRDYYRVLGGMHLDVSRDSCPLPYWRFVRNALEAPQQPKVQAILDRVFGPVWQRLNDYWFDTYLSSSTYQEDRELVRFAGRAARRVLVELWQEQWLKAIAYSEQAFRQDLKHLKAETALQEDAASQAQVRYEAIKKQIVVQRAKRIRIARDAREDLERCKRFTSLLEQEYGAAFDQQYATALGQQEAVDALLGMLSCIALSQQYQEFQTLNQLMAS